MVIKLRSKNYITSLYNCCIIAQKLLMLKQGIKTISFKFVQTCSLSRSVQNLYNLVPVGFSLLWQCQKVKGPLRLRSRPLLMQGLRFLFRTWIIWKIGTVILFKRTMAEKDICHAHKFHSLDRNFSFCMDFLHCWWLLKVEKE